MFIHDLNPVLIDLGVFQLRWYSIAYILGILLGWLYANKIINKLEYNNKDFDNVTKSQFDNLIVYLILGIVFGGRLGYVFFYDFTYYAQNFLEIFQIWKGGMSFHGGLLGVIVATLIFSKYERNTFFKYTDIISCVSPIGIFFGRISNFINGELYGKATLLPWAVIFKSGDNIPRHPSQIYEALLEGLLLFALINYFALKKELLLKPGYISCIFLILYSILRIFSENFREPDLHIGYIFNYFSMGSVLSFVTIFLALLIFLYIKKNEQNN